MSAPVASAQVVTPDAPVDVGKARKAAVKGILGLAAHLARSHPETGAQGHLRDAADQVRIANDHGALRHLKAAGASLGPGSLRRLGIHDDDSHLGARQALGEVVRHHLAVSDLQDAEARNQALARRDSPGDDTAAPPGPENGYGPGALAQKPSAAPPPGNRALNAPARVPAGRTGPDVAGPDAPSRRGPRQFARPRDEPGAVDLATRLSKAEARYRPGGTPGHRCGDCTMFRPSPAGDHCTLVEGLIDPGRVCDHFDPKEARALSVTWDDLATLVVDLSARTPYLSATPAPYGKPAGPGLYGVKGNTHSPYFEQVVQALVRKRGMSRERASATAWAALRRWEAKSRHPEVKAAAGGGLAREKQAEERAHGHARTWDEVAAVLDLAQVNVRTYQRTVNTPNGPRVEQVTQHDQNYRSGTGQPGTGQPGAGQAPPAQPNGKSQWQALPSRRAEKARLLATAKGYRERAAVLRVQEAAYNSALYRALYGSNTTQAQAGAVTAAQAGATTAAQAGSTTAASAPSASAQAATAATAAGATAAQVSQAKAGAATAAAKMSVPQLRATITRIQAQVTWYTTQADTLTAQAARLP